MTGAYILVLSEMEQTSDRSQWDRNEDKIANQGWSTAITCGFSLIYIGIWSQGWFNPWLIPADN
jgi:hypothetical protein